MGGGPSLRFRLLVGQVVVLAVVCIDLVSEKLRRRVIEAVS